MWDSSFETWQAFGVTGQPAAVLVSPAGKVLVSWQGAFDEGDVLAALQ